MNQREKFEAWGNEYFNYGFKTDAFRDNEYEHEETQMAWEGWQAALAASGGNAAPELPEPLEIDWPTLNSNALGCGVEDRGLHDRYECAEYGWQDGFDMAASCVPDAIYDADQMREYGKACAAASAPNAALVAALKGALAVIDDYLAYTHDGDPWTEDARSMGEMDINDADNDGRIDSWRAALSAAGQEVKP